MSINSFCWAKLTLTSLLIQYIFPSLTKVTAEFANSISDKEIIDSAALKVFPMDHPIWQTKNIYNDTYYHKNIDEIIDVIALKPMYIQIPSNKSAYPSALMYFRLTPKILLDNIISAEFWFRNRANSSLQMVVSEINNEPFPEYPKQLIALNIRVKPLSWYKVEVGPNIRNWLSSQDDFHKIEVSCRRCDRAKGPVDIEENKPLIIIRTNSTSSRPVRSTCNDSNSNGCCLQQLYINFTDIGWSEWIVQPSGYMANYCKGSCINDIDRYRYYYSTVMRELIRKKGAMASNLNLGLCCTPSKMSSISLIYREDNNVFYRKDLPNMVVEECDCA